MHGEKMKKGDAILFLYQSAGRDEREFQDRDRFDILWPKAPRSMRFGPATINAWVTSLPSWRAE